MHWLLVKEEVQNDDLSMLGPLASAANPKMTEP